jgi:hypothetical protein
MNNQKIIKNEEYKKINLLNFFPKNLFKKWYRVNIPVSNWNYLEFQPIDRRSNLYLK